MMLVNYNGEFTEIGSYSEIYKFRGSFSIIENGKRNVYEKYNLCYDKIVDGHTLGVQFYHVDNLHPEDNDYSISIITDNFGYLRFDFPSKDFLYFPLDGGFFNMSDIPETIHKNKIRNGLFRYFDKIVFDFSDYLDKESMEYKEIRRILC